MTHFRGQIRGPHWGPTLDNMLIEFWRRHECLFNSSLDSYYDKEFKTKLWTEFALSIGKPVSDVERRSRSLRTQYGRVLYHPDRVSTAQQKMLKEKLYFLRPYIVRRRGDSCLEEKFIDQEEDNEEFETEGSIDQEMGSSLGSPLDTDVTGQDLDDEPQSVASTPNLVPLLAPTLQPQVTEVMSLSCPRHHSEEGSSDQLDQSAAPSTSKHDILNQFAEVMLADMRQIKDPIVLMRLRRDITDLVFTAVEEDTQRRCVRESSAPAIADRTQSCSGSQQQRSQTIVSWRQRFLKRKSRVGESGRMTQRGEDMKHMRRMTRSQSSLPVQQGQAVEGLSENGSQGTVQAFDIKRETEPHIIKIEDEPFPLP